MARYVPNTYNNKRLLRILIATVITVLVSIVVLFLVLFFVFQRYVVDGRLEIPWLEDFAPQATPAVVADETNDE